ncbi:MAG: putative porin [Alphaproteobacteria bacterium]|nr:putative porin [Alphaproteobacteria bacterium]
MASRCSFFKGAVSALTLALASAPAFAQSTPASSATPAAAAAAPSSNATINLIRLLVKQGVISQRNADALVAEAEQEAAQARAQQSVASASPAAPPPPAPGVVRVPYVPEIVKKQIRDEVKQEVLAEARRDNWAQPEAVPAWSKRIKLHGDFRFRDEADIYSKNNTDEFIDFASFNANGPTDINSATNPFGLPFLNTRSNRYDRLSFRARLGVDATVVDGVDVGLRLASGGDNGPVSTTQLLGGGFGKKDIWLDQAFLSLRPSRYLDLMAGRMPNPFFSTDLVWDPDLNFDGIALTGDSKRPRWQGLSLFSSVGFFPIGYVGTNFPNNCGPLCSKSAEYQKWLLGGQVGLDWTEGNFDWRFGAAAYDFHNMQGELSTPCFTYLDFKECSTDQTRPAFMQKGNTLFLIRELVPPPPPEQAPEPQFVGLSFKYDVADVNQQLSYRIDDTQSITFGLDYARNLAYDTKYACRYAPLGLPITNIAPGGGGYIDACDTPTQGGLSKAKIQSGPNAYYANLTLGDPAPRSFGAWNVSLGYKYIEPDAVPDAFTDSDFHLGGTNAKGFIIGGSLGIYDNTWITARYLSANEVYGAPLAIDVAQLDLNARF